MKRLGLALLLIPALASAASWYPDGEGTGAMKYYAAPTTSKTLLSTTGTALYATEDAYGISPSAVKAVGSVAFRARFSNSSGSPVTVIFAFGYYDGTFHLVCSANYSAQANLATTATVSCTPDSEITMPVGSKFAMTLYSGTTSIVVSGNTTDPAYLTFQTVCADTAPGCACNGICSTAPTCGNTISMAPDNSLGSYNEWAPCGCDCTSCGPTYYASALAAPTGLACTDLGTGTGVRCNWTGYGYTSNIPTYEIRRGSTLLGTTTSTTYLDTGATSGSFSYSLGAYGFCQPVPPELNRGISGFVYTPRATITVGVRARGVITGFW